MSGIFEISTANAKEPEYSSNNLLEGGGNLKKLPPVPAKKPEYNPNNLLETKSNDSVLQKAKRTGIYKESAKFDRLVDSVFGEEGDFEDDLNKIDQPTNMGIIQGTLNNFNKAHPELKINKSLKDITRDDAKLIYKLDFYDAYHLEKINNEKSSKVLMHMFVMLKPNTTLDILHKSLNDAGYSSKRLLTKEMIPTLNKIEKDNKSQEFNEILKKNYIDYLKVQPDARKYRGWFLRVRRL